MRPARILLIWKLPLGYSQISLRRPVQVGAYVVSHFDSLLQAYSGLSPTLKAPPPPVSQPIYNPSFTSIPAGTYPQGATAPPSAASGR